MDAKRLIAVVLAALLLGLAYVSLLAPGVPPASPAPHDNTSPRSAPTPGDDSAKPAPASEALARADLGVAVASGTDVAIESADVVLMQNDLGKLAGAVRLARAARRTVIINLAFAFGIILIVAPLAVAGKVPLPLGVVAHEGGTVFVVFMGLRLLARRL